MRFQFRNLLTVKHIFFLKVDIFLTTSSFIHVWHADVTGNVLVFKTAYNFYYKVKMDFAPEI